ncbi:MAG TPA: hypothetical protein DDY52_00110 [Candidatus Moranbacteria bacterium]|nr:MAG: hypothetical protein UR51_C0011G0055 [Candidatus Moranbacteria bacterium GW2011_GWF1_34_10]HBI16551.1 hypothetical protein [Candidatus Moranbacteria bacterium]
MSSIRSLSLREITLGFGGIIICFILFWTLFLFIQPLLVFLMIFGFLFILFIFIKPLYGLLFLIILRPTLDIFTSKAILAVGDYSLNIASLLAIGITILSAILIIQNLNKLKSIPLKLPWLIFIFITFTSIFHSANIFTSLAEWLRILSIFSLYLLGFIFIKNSADLKKLIYTIILSALVPGLMAFYQFFTKTGMAVIDEDITNRIFGTFAHPNLLAYYLTLPIVLIIFLILNKEKYLQKNILLYCFFIFSFSLLVLTYTRGAWVVFLIVIFTLGIIQYKKFLLGALTGLLLLYLLVPPLNTRVNNLFQYNPYSSIQWRINLWKDGFKYSQEEIITGYGLGTASKIILDKRGEKFGSPDPHNDYLKILIENGILGLAAYCFIVLSLLSNLIKGYMKANSIFNKNFFLLLIGISFALYFMSFADNVFRNTALQWVFWILLGALFSIHQKSLSSSIK